jgi:hypothetical protein
MALKITSEIGTDQGITSEAYVRIMNYNINKGGQANFALQTFNSEAAATALSLGVSSGASLGVVARNAKIGESFYVPLTKEEISVFTVTKPIPTEVEVTEEVIIPGVDGEPDTTETVTKIVIQTVMTEVEETIAKTVPDMTPVIGVDVFSFGYGKLKTHLESLFGEGNVVDC